MSKSNVLILGATGNTGSSIVDALLDSPGTFKVIAAIRPSSASKPAVEELKSRGVEIRLLDLEHASPEQLVETLRGVDTIISTIVFTQLQLQRPLVDASKKAGVKRFIPCDWGTASIRGVRKMYDEKLGIHDYIKEVGLGYTFVDVGWWMQLMPPMLDPSTAQYPIQYEMSVSICGTGDVKTAVTDRRDIGKFVARIIADERTLNRYVFCWTENVSKNKAFRLAERVLGRTVDSVHVPEEVVVTKAREAQGPEQTAFQYHHSLWIRGDNTVENAKKEEYGGALDAKELYPDLKLISFEQSVKDFYSS
ncbi:NAD-binding protein [Phellopilus nigrolimitatus]|nr:NAD-binding protein [Phellopilus nigrolimitatus]